MEVIIKQIEAGVANAYVNIQEYLKFFAKFYKYSLNNTMLIASQKPEATLVASFKKWKEMGRNVKKGEKGIKILAPCTYKTVEEKDGEEKEKEHLYFRVVYVFDISQTEGKEIPEICKELNDLEEIPKSTYSAFFTGVKNATNSTILVEEITGGAKGYYMRDSGNIVINKGMSQTQTLKTLVHEGAHALLHNKESEIADITKEAKEIQAEAVAFTVLNYYGLDSSEYSFPYIATWSQGKGVDILKQYLLEVTTAVKLLIENIDKNIK